MKTIKARIARFVILLVAGSIVLVGGVAIALNYTSTNGLLKQTMGETAILASARVSNELRQYEIIATESGSIARLASQETTVEAKKEIVDQRAKEHNLQRGNILDMNGISIFDGKDYKDREYFQEAIKGRPHISEPVVSKITGELSIIVAAPLWKDGVPETEVVGVVYYVPKETFLNDIMDSIHISPNSTAYMLSKEGITIAHHDIKRVEEQENIEELAKKEPKLAKLAAIHAKMCQGKDGFSQYEFGGVKKFIAYAPVSESDGWSIGVSAPTKDFMKGTTDSIIITIAILMICIIGSTFMAFYIGAKIARPISMCAGRLVKLSEGDLKTEVPEVTTKDETRLLADATKKIVKTMGGIIKDMEYGLNALANGDFTVDSQAKELYVGDFGQMAVSMYGIIDKLTGTLLEIDRAADQVASGSSQVSDGAQELSSGSTEQAASVEELSATIADISSLIQDTTANVVEAKSKTDSVGAETLQCNSKMQEMLQAMNDISGSSSEIGKIIKTIEDIAFQTNILALNAAVEAARAGAAGKGFAVVADEVRNLASKSAEASKNTSGLIEGSIHAVERGTLIAGETAKSLEGVVEKNRAVIEMVDEIASKAEQQAMSMEQVTQAVDQISSVVQTTSATAEESAASSEELAGQSQVLRDLVESFKLNRERN